ncbi:MAG: hypothetical protein ACE5G2_10080 [Candidatus Krumholzibacteriia bacterium]
MSFLAPWFEGRLEVGGIPDDFMKRLEERVRNGLFIPGSRLRANYRVEHASRDAVKFAAEDSWTAINIGLNEVTVRRSARAELSYDVRFWRWTGYCVVLSAVVATGIALIWPFIGHEIEAWPPGRFLFWGNVVFWGIAWPWVLTALHKKPAARCLERILLEELREP